LLRDIAAEEMVREEKNWGGLKRLVARKGRCEFLMEESTERDMGSAREGRGKEVCPRGERATGFG